MRLIFWALIAAVLALSGYIIRDEIMMSALEPFSKVEIVEAAVHEDGVRFRANFTKNPRGKLGECDLLKFAVYGVDFNSYKPVFFTDLDGRPEDDSREAGAHTLDILIATKPLAYEVYEARTQHKCAVEAEDGAIVYLSVTRVFARIDLS